MRGEAIAGFPALFDVYVRAYDESRDMDRLSLTVMSSADDTNVIHRAGLENLRMLQMMAREVLDGKRHSADLDAWCLERNISTGGSADLIGATIFAWLIRAHYTRLKGGTP
jgi:triphosphoribosyl-dephospho-CoA synthetase